MTLIANKQSLEDKIAFCLNAIALSPEDPYPYCFLASLRLLSGQHFAALALINQAIDLCPTYGEAWAVKGEIAEVQGSKLVAIECYQTALKLTPLFEAPRSQLARLTSPEEAARIADSYWPTVAKTPNTPTILNDMYDEAALRELLAKDGPHPECLVKIALVLFRHNRQLEAERFAVYTLQISPNNSDALVLLASQAQQSNRQEDAFQYALRALDASPDHAIAANMAMSFALNICAWDRIDEIRTRALEALSKHPQAADPVEALLYVPVPALQASVARAFGFSASRLKSDPEVDAVRQANIRLHLSRVWKHAPRITIGYLSSDFHPHPIGRLMAELIRHHDRSKFIVRAYSTWPAPDNDLRQSVQQNVDSFDELYGMDAATAGQKIMNDGVQILIDLSGYTRNNRLDVLAQQVAPIQVTYAGYLGTLGVPFIQYQIVDTTVSEYADLLAMEESLIRLPHSMLAGDRHAFIKPTPSLTRADVGLPEDVTVFCNFSLPNRLNPTMFNVWMRILARVPKSVLWLAHSEPNSAARLRAWAQGQGIDPNRIIIGERVPYEEYLQRLACADLFLDTFPQNAGAVGNDALWMCCPVLTCAGIVFQSRVGAGMARSAGIPELVTDSLEAYEERAVQFGSNRQSLMGLRQKLVAARDTEPMFDPEQMVRHMEWAYNAIWIRYLEHLPPSQVDVPAIN
jgi:predicted O-linked N-acetylglucosamine transferase (SPINDLY family)